MKRFFVIILCRVLYFIGSKMGRGSSLPGEIALRICPDILHRLTLPKFVIAVTGSNGKTSTTEIISHILAENGMSVACNKEGSNQIEGVATLLLRTCNLKGSVNADALIIESDERYARKTFKYFTPTHFIITNLYRDQLTRNGHPEWIYNIIKEAIKEDTILILNANDPLVSLFGKGRKNTIWFSMDENSYSSSECSSTYNDGKYCPNCKNIMGYDYYHYNHIGKFACPACGHKTEKSQYTVTDMDLVNKTMTINGMFQINLGFASTFNVYNILAAFAAASIVGIGPDAITESLNGYILKNGRIIDFAINNHKGVLLTSKHENSISYNQSIVYVKNQPTPSVVMFIVDAVSRKYFTSETSWLWDIDFDLLKSSNVVKIILSGTFAYDLATRLEYTSIPSDKILCVPKISDATDMLYDDKSRLYAENSTKEEDIFVITCFSDKDKFQALIR